MTAPEQAFAKLDEAATHPTPDHATGYANLTRAEAIAIRAEVGRLQRQLEEANERALDAAAEAIGRSEGQAIRAEAAVAQLRQALEATQAVVKGVSAALPPRCYRRPDSKLEADPGPCGKCAACMAINATREPDGSLKQVVRDALAGSVPATGTDDETGKAECFYCGATNWTTFNDDGCSRCLPAGSTAEGTE